VDNSTFRAEYGPEFGFDCEYRDALWHEPVPRRVFEYFGTMFWCPDLFKLCNDEFKSIKPADHSGAITSAHRWWPIVRTHILLSQLRGVRHRQGININTLVLSDGSERRHNRPGNPTVLKLLPLIPPANVNRMHQPLHRHFRWQRRRSLNLDQGTATSATLQFDDQLHGYYASSRTSR